MKNFRSLSDMPGMHRLGHLIRFLRLSPLGFLIVGCLISPDGSKAQAVHYAGKVLDQDGKPLAAATVKLDGSSITVQSGADGAFDISGTLAVRRMAPSLLSSLDPSGNLHLADGRSLGTGAWAQGVLLTPLDGGRKTTAAPLAKPGAADETGAAQAARGAATAQAAPAASATAANAAYVLSVTKTGYFNRSFSQSRTSALNLNLALTKRPDTTGGFQAEKKLCMDEANRYRATLGLKAVAWSAALEAYADEGARYDAARDQAHAHFGAVKPNPADAENEIPGWPLSNYKTVAAIMEGGIKMMWDEGPGGGHYENIKGNHTLIGCGIHITDEGDVWIVQDLK